MNFKELLNDLNACCDSKEWANEMPIKEVVSKCHRGDWLLWLAQKLDIDFRVLTLAKGRCAETVIYLMKDERSINAVRLSIDFGNGLVDLEYLNAAADAAAAAYAAAAAAADAAAAAYAAAAAAADAAYAAYAAAAAADAAYAAYAAADAKEANQLKTAEICREILGQLIIEKVNQKLN